MAKIGLIEKNKKRQKLTKSFKGKRNKLKEQIYDKNLPLNERFDLVIKLAKMPRNSSAVRVRNRCSLTGRSRGYYRKMGLSRILIRELAGKGMLPGVVKASW